MGLLDDYYGGLQRGIGRGLGAAGDFLGNAVEDQLSPLGPLMSPQGAGQRRALFNQADIGAGAKRAAEIIQSSQSGQRQGSAGSLMSQRDPQFSDVESGHSSTALPDLVSERRSKPENYIRFDLGDGLGMEDYHSDPNDNRAHSETDWSKVANPMAFEAYRERPERAVLEMQAKDPFAVQRAEAGIAADRAKSIYEGQRGVEADIQNRRGGQYAAAAQAEMQSAQDAINAIKQLPGLSQAEKDDRIAQVQDRMSERLRVLRESAGYSKETVRG